MQCIIHQANKKHTHILWEVNVKVEYEINFWRLNQMVRQFERSGMEKTENIAFALAMKGEFVVRHDWHLPWIMMMISSSFGCDDFIAEEKRFVVALSIKCIHLPRTTNSSCILFRRLSKNPEVIYVPHALFLALSLSLQNLSYIGQRIRKLKPKG